MVSRFLLIFFCFIPAACTASTNESLVNGSASQARANFFPTTNILQPEHQGITFKANIHVLRTADFDDEQKLVVRHRHGVSVWMNIDFAPHFHEMFVAEKIAALENEDLDPDQKLKIVEFYEQHVRYYQGAIPNLNDPDLQLQQRKTEYNQAMSAYIHNVEVDLNGQKYPAEHWTLYEHRPDRKSEGAPVRFSTQYKIFAPIGTLPTVGVDVSYQDPNQDGLKQLNFIIPTIQATTSAQLSFRRDTPAKRAFAVDWGVESELVNDVSIHGDFPAHRNSATPSNLAVFCYGEESVDFEARNKMIGSEKIVSDSDNSKGLAVYDFPMEVQLGSTSYYDHPAGIGYRPDPGQIGITLSNTFGIYADEESPLRSGIVIGETIEASAAPPEDFLMPPKACRYWNESNCAFEEPSRVLVCGTVAG